ncbi:helix-turn-helix transcriptional regulator [Paenibacillus macerans]|uniref:Helix-turn-helix family protein n=1 Tax=Paenibacillus macerans TaxID=44252 RepID=A0A090ZVS4_PAEMA|nr:helix-turn-helix transcriptional regulator [Paenibacillus macerans]KFN08226.1 helix-turn-helix family protein [Paenibacillus macerans]MCY7557714.1 helix-turn-helix domain-containing protein [Paenibacillus macerans]MEC0141367.1 helix-turn-helix transcriptional regulator [Paenibacillus macerans]MEC0152399.1 helix-turn-helix transcriptional regulator [Paenibacillus macerans]GBK65491.1 XRE family transcriptional regulator [Paenibacillus macerans]
MYKRIRDLREDRDLTQQQLADFLNISQATYSRYESGNLDVPSSVLIMLSEFYDVSIDYILGQTNNSKRHNGK